MKSILVVLAVIVFSEASAQGRFGLTVGSQLAKLNGPEGYTTFSDPRIGFRLGGLYEHDLSKRFGIRQELSYSLAGGKSPNDNTIGISYLSLPLLAYYKPAKKFKILLGPELNVLLGHHTKAIGRTIDFKPVDFGISFGAEYLFSERFGVSLRNYFGLTYASEYDANDYIQPGDQLIDFEPIKYDRSNIFQLSVTYYF